MGCKRATMRVVKSLADSIQPGLIRFAVDTAARIERVGTEDPDFLTNGTKRKLLVSEIKAEWRRTATDATVALTNRAVNLVAEVAVNAAKSDVPNEDFAPDDDDASEIIVP